MFREMGNTIKIRNSNDLWWTDILLSEAYTWDNFEISYLGPENCFVLVNGEKMEMSIDSYQQIMDNKAFKIKFGIKSHDFNF
jgi:hypothetical protein